MAGENAGLRGAFDTGVIELLTAADAERRQRRVAGALAARGLRAGDRVVFALPSSALLLCAVLGALRTGVVPVLLHAALLPSERDVLVADADARLTVLDAESLAALDDGDPVALAPYPLARPMHYTSGTTGRAKGVWTGIWDERVAQSAFADEADLWGFGPDDVHLVCSPMYHSVSTRFAGGTLLRGGTCLVLDRFDAFQALAALAGRAGPRATTTFMAPTALQRLLDAAGGDPGPLDALRLLVHAGSACPPALKRVAMDAVGPGVLWEFYGATEGQFTVCGPDEWLAHPGTVGRARPGRRLHADADGTIWCEPPAYGRFTYWNDPDKTARAWRNGAFTVGDQGRIDPDGYLFLDGRRDDLIITGGVNVYPVEVEAALSETPGVSEVAVFALPDDQWGEAVCAVLVPEGSGGVHVDGGSARVADPGAGRVGAWGGDQGGERLVASARRVADEHLAPHKRPKRYVVTASLPTTPTGKVRRRELPAFLGLAGAPEDDQDGAVGPSGG
ncbi:MAG: AMP-binding protein [Actinomycetota bacterium]|nr:AMP-binding protein [Actinomycetota bacterium]